MNSAVRMHHDIESELRRVDWGEIGVRLTAYAVRKARNLRWRTGRVDALAGGKTPEDLAGEAILKVLDGERAWDPERGALLPYLQGVVDSLLSHLAASADNRSQERWTDAHERAEEAPPPFDPDDRLDRLGEALRRDGQQALDNLVLAERPVWLVLI
jgi:DNA-directed RNA polymerase specialized sigma24 family protein